MKEKTGRFTINEDEILEMYGYMFAMMPKNQKRMLWLKGSIPLLVVFTLFYFRAQVALWWIVSGILAVLIWLKIFSRKIWDRFIMHQVQQWYKKNNGMMKTKEVQFIFSDSIKIDQRAISYAEIRQIIPLKHILIFIISEQDLFVLPTRVFASEKEMKEFSKMLKEKRACCTDK